MERYMYQDDSFERMLKQKADEYRMYPSTQTWDKIQKRVQKKNSFISVKSIGLTIVLLSAFSLYLSNDQNTDTKISFLAADISSIKTPAVIQATNKATRLNNVVVEVRNHNKTSELSSSEVEKGTQPVTETTETGVIVTESPAVTEEFMLTKAVNDHSSSFSKPDLLISETVAMNTPINAFANQAAVVITEESPSLKTDAELNYEVNIPVIIKTKEVRQLQLYVTPSISYRVLYADNKIAFGNLPQQDPENAAIHRAATGFEAGVSVLFPAAKKIKFRTGLQFNYTHYNVNAFNAAPQLTTIRLNYSSIQRVTTLNNNYGYYAKDVANETFQISIPVGVEFKLAGKKKVQWDLATNIQPSYLLKASGYLLTNDLKNYVKAPDLLSHLNLNTSLETFIRWNAGAFSLQAGPQLRYQLFSNARGEYPIREHLVDYGFRIGIVKPLH